MMTRRIVVRCTTHIPACILPQVAGHPPFSRMVDGAPPQETAPEATESPVARLDARKHATGHAVSVHHATGDCRAPVQARLIRDE